MEKKRVSQEEWGKVAAICTSEKKGTPKTEVNDAVLKKIGELRGMLMRGTGTGR